MTDEMPFTEPTESEAFPGLYFGLLTNRDRVTLASHDPANGATVNIVSLDRRGFVVRHSMPGTYTALPPTDNGMVPVYSGPEGDVPRATPRATPRADRPQGVAHPHTGISYRFRDNGDRGLAIEANLSGGWHPIAYLDQNSSLHLIDLAGSTLRYLRDYGIITTPENDRGQSYYPLATTYNVAPHASPRPTIIEDDFGEDRDSEDPDEDLNIPDEPEPDHEFGVTTIDTGARAGAGGSLGGWGNAVVTPHIEDPHIAEARETNRRIEEQAQLAYETAFAATAATTQGRSYSHCCREAERAKAAYLAQHPLTPIT